MMFTRVVSLSLFAFAACSSSPSGDPTDGGDGDVPPGDGGGGGGGGGEPPGTGDGSGSGADPLKHYRSGTRIKARVLTTPDGAKTLHGWRDTTLAIDCYFGTAADGVTRCIPNAPIDQGTYFSDAACTIPVVVSAIYAYGTPKYAGQYVSLDAYPLRYRFYNVGAKVTPYYYKSTTACSVQAAQPSLEAYLRLAEVPPTTFQSATEALE
jgi:hypothetical protein